MEIDILVSEIGSTTTIVNAFNGINTSQPCFLGQGMAPTSVREGDVTIGLQKAMDQLALTLKIKNLNYQKMFAASSAAGGLKMAVHGLVYDMTVKAAKEAALGAGANLHIITAGKLRRLDLEKIRTINPNIILIAGGFDFGERETALENAEKICGLKLKIPVIYAGNIANQEEIEFIFKESDSKLYLTENVYPKVDLLNVEPARKIIQHVFEEHIIYAPGMSQVKDMIKGAIMPVPGAVMQAAKLLKQEIGDLLVLDVGGATTDVHSVANDCEEISRILIAPEPEAKRTVEGDLGLYENLTNIVEQIGSDQLCNDLGFDPLPVVSSLGAIPQTEQQLQLVERLCLEAVLTAVKRHAGRKNLYFGSNGSKVYAEGKDLSQVGFIIGTGGALTRLPGRQNILAQITRQSDQLELLPGKEAKILIDRFYIMSSIGVLSLDYPQDALSLLKKSLRI